MKILCAWCKAIIRHDSSMFFRPDPEEQVSHGICPKCYAEQEKVLSHMGPAGDHATVTDADLGGEGG